MLCPKGHQPFGTKAQHAVTFDPLVRLASLIVLGAPWMGMWALFRIATGRHERYTAPGDVWPAAGPEAAGTPAAQ
jgi:hypothetical protein